ncbi:SEC1 family transport protein SLY1 [Vairimorpha necatrix]|uniref:SEC1 family transport protein SLY1 n=1 Tax=Vairimorpha necatrix TaxID=6039 RepID=A0AAX4JFP4_9MICR
MVKLGICQKERILSFLNTPHPWKILILDSVTQSILSPLLSSKDLRDCGITSYFLISNKRLPVSNTPALYFVSDISNIYKDILDNLYTEYLIYSVSNIKRKDLENLGLILGRKGLGHYITQIYDQYVDFISLQEDLYTFNITNSYINKDNLDIYKNILSIFITIKSKPTIISTDNLTNHYQDILKQISKNNIIQKFINKSLLILINRDYDIINPIKHSWSYSSLISDLLDLKNNKLKIKNKIFNLDLNDEIYKNNMNEYFPIVVENVEEELLKYKKEVACKLNILLDKTNNLIKQNEKINKHIEICTEILRIIKERSLDEFYKVQNNDNININNINTLVNDDFNDLLRLGLVIGDYDLLKSKNIKSKLIDFYKKLKEEKNQNFNNFVGKILKNVLPVKEKSPISDLVQDIWNQRKEEYKNIVVCMIGGATYSELKTLKILEEKIRVPIIYGGTEVLNSKEFMDQVNETL